jgi:hypothetical protein
MATAVQRTFTIRDVAFSVGQFLPLKDCAAYSAVSKIFRQLATTLGFPQIVRVQVRGDHLVDFAASPLKFKKLTALTIPDLRQGAVIPASFNRGTIDELRIVAEGETNQEKIKELIRATEQVRILRIGESESDVLEMSGRFFEEDVRRKVSELAVLELSAGNVRNTGILFDLLYQSNQITRVALSLWDYSDVIVDLISRKPLIREISLLRESPSSHDEEVSPLRGCKGLTRFAPDNSVTEADLLAIVEKNRDTLGHLALPTEYWMTAMPRLLLLPRLQSLGISSISIPFDLSPLQRIPTLTKLMLHGLETPDGLSLEEAQAFVRTLPRVKSLFVHCSCPLFYAALSASMIQLTELGISSAQPLNSDLGDEIAKLTNLKDLILMCACDKVADQNIVPIIQRCEKLASLKYSALQNYEVLDEIHAVVAHRVHSLRFSNRLIWESKLDPNFVQWKSSHLHYTKLILDLDDGRPS